MTICVLIQIFRVWSIIRIIRIKKTTFFPVESFIDLNLLAQNSKKEMINENLSFKTKRYIGILYDNSRRRYPEWVCL
jgi:hypothetical protein